MKRFFHAFFRALNRPMAPATGPSTRFASGLATPRSRDADVEPPRARVRSRRGPPRWFSSAEGCPRRRLAVLADYRHRQLALNSKIWAPKNNFFDSRASLTPASVASQKSKANLNRVICALRPPAGRICSRRYWLGSGGCASKGVHLQLRAPIWTVVLHYPNFRLLAPIRLIRYGPLFGVV